MNETEAAELYAERAEHYRNQDAIYQRNLSDVVTWRYANVTPDPLLPEGPLAKIEQRSDTMPWRRPKPRPRHHSRPAQ